MPRSFQRQVRALFSPLCALFWAGQVLALASAGPVPNCTLPTFSVGTLVKGSKELNAVVKKERLVLVAFAASSCVHCCLWEGIYEEVLPELTKRKAKLLRVDIDDLSAKGLASNYEIESLPAVLLFQKRRPIKLAEDVRPANLLALLEHVADPLPKLALEEKATGQGDHAGAKNSFWSMWDAPQKVFLKSWEQDSNVQKTAVRVAAMLGPKARGDDDLEEELTEAAAAFATRPLTFQFARAGDAEALKFLADHPMVSSACGEAVRAAAKGGNKRLMTLTSLFDGEYVDISRLQPSEKKSGALFLEPPKGDSTAVGGAVFQQALLKSTGPLEVLPRVECRSLDAYDGESLEQWILRAALPPVGRFDSQTSALYEKTGKPFLLLFVDPTKPELATWLRPLFDAQKRFNAPATSLGTSGSSISLGGLDRKEALRLVFAYVDAREHLHRMKSLGLVPDLNRLPALAFNSMTQKILTWQPAPGEAEKSPKEFREVVDSLIQRFFQGDYQGLEEAKVVAPEPIPQRNLEAGERRNVPELEKLSLQDRLRFVQGITSQDFDAVVMDNSKDVIVFFYSSAEGPPQEACKQVAIFVNRCAERFAELGITSVRLAKLDTFEASLPAGLQIPKVPSLVLFPAFSKGPPHLTYNSKWKVQHIMWWVQDHASLNFKLPELPHLDALEAKSYWQQKAELPKEKQERIEMESESSHRPKKASPKRRGRARRRGGKAGEL